MLDDKLRLSILMDLQDELTTGKFGPRTYRELAHRKNGLDFCSGCVRALYDARLALGLDHRCFHKIVRG